MTTSSIHATVMRRVRFIHLVRPLTAPMLVASLIVLVSLWGIGREVWVAEVFHNMPSPAHLAAFARFSAAAFLNTQTIVQALTLLALAAGIWLARAIARVLAAALRYA